MMLHRCTIERDKQTIKSDYNVNNKPQWVTDETSIKCRLIPQVSNVRGMGGIVGEGSPINLRDFVKRVQQFLLPKGTDITEADRIVNVVDRAGRMVNAGPFNILLVRSATSSAAHHVRVIAETPI